MGVCRAGVLKDRPPGSAASKPTGTLLPLRGARVSGWGLSAPSRDHTMGAVSPASSTDQTEVGGAARASFHRSGCGGGDRGAVGHPAEVCGWAGESLWPMLGPLKTQKPPGLKDGWGNWMRSLQGRGPVQTASQACLREPQPGSRPCQHSCRPRSARHLHTKASPQRPVPSPSQAGPRASPVARPRPARVTKQACGPGAGPRRHPRWAQGPDHWHHPGTRPRPRCLFRQAHTHPAAWLCNPNPAAIC